MSYADFHNVADGLDTILFIILIVGGAWTWLASKQ